MTPAMSQLIRTLALVELGEATHEQLREALTAADADPAPPAVNIRIAYWTMCMPMNVHAATDTEIKGTYR